MPTRYDDTFGWDYPPGVNDHDISGSSDSDACNGCCQPADEHDHYDNEARHDSMMRAYADWRAEHPLPQCVLDEAGKDKP